MNDTNSIKMVLAVLFMPLLLIIIPLNWIGGIGSVIWCVINGKWLVLFASLLGVVFGFMLLGFALLIPLVFAIPLVNSDGQGSKTVTGVLMFLLCVTRVTILSAWAFLVFKLFHGLLPDDRIIVCIIVFLQVSGAINHLAKKNSNDEDDPSRLLAAISSVGCLFSLITWYFFPVANYHLFIYPTLQLLGECILVQDMIWQKKHGF